MRDSVKRISPQPLRNSPQTQRIFAARTIQQLTLTPLRPASAKRNGAAPPERTLGINSRVVVATIPWFIKCHIVARLKRDRQLIVFIFWLVRDESKCDTKFFN